MRSPAEAHADRDACAQLCGILGVPFVTHPISVSRVGNIEANARRQRYAALTALARDNGCHFVATGHHAEDQLETLLMRLIRGCGQRGLRGIAPRRPLSDAVSLIRPMLELRRVDAQRLCAACNWAWRIDATNADTARSRSRIRHDLLPLIESIAPGAALRANAAADVAAAAWHVIRCDAAALLRDSGRGPGRWTREPWTAAPRAVVAEAITSIVRSAGGVPRYREAIAATRAIRSRSGEIKRFQFEGCALLVEADAIRVEA